MIVSDYMVEFLIKKGITDVFGYPGGMVTQLMDSFARFDGQISAHLNYHEQAAAFAACGYAQTSGKPGVAYATSGPGATNLITGICNAFFDSIPSIFITGQVNNNELAKGYGVRQRGFQETDIISIVTPVTKYAVQVNDAEQLPIELEKAYEIAVSGRPGPVLLDIPMDVFRTSISAYSVTESTNINNDRDNKNQSVDAILSVLSSELSSSLRPVILVGNGVKLSGMRDGFREVVSQLGIPTVSSMVAFDVIGNNPLNYGFIGAYGDRAANFIVAKSDLVIVIGSRMDIRQVGAKREEFAPNAKIIRFEVDLGELSYRVHKDEIQICANIKTVIHALKQVRITKNYYSWIKICDEIKKILHGIDDNRVSKLINTISKSIPEDAVITTDVGQNQVWIAQSFLLKPNQNVLFSGGHGAMGYSLPASIGAYYGSGKRPVFCVSGDGGIQMNIQEFQFISRERLPIKVVVLNNNSLGMIRHFQEKYYDRRYYQTKPEGGYTAPDFSKIADAYGFLSRRVQYDEIAEIEWNDGPELLEIIINEDTYVTPKLRFGNPNQDQEPLIDRNLYSRIMGLNVDD